MREWIRVEDRLPETDDYVWVTVDEDYYYGDIGNKFVSVSFYDKYEPKWDRYDGFVVAWMPIENKPDPYEE